MINRISLFVWSLNHLTCWIIDTLLIKYATTLTSSWSSLHSFQPSIQECDECWIHFSFVHSIDCQYFVLWYGSWDTGVVVKVVLCLKIIWQPRQLMSPCVSCEIIYHILGETSQRHVKINNWVFGLFPEEKPCRKGLVRLKLTLSTSMCSLGQTLP